MWSDPDLKPVVIQHTQPSQLKCSHNAFFTTMHDCGADLFLDSILNHPKSQLQSICKYNQICQLLHICAPPFSQLLSCSDLHQVHFILLLFAFFLICLYLCSSLLYLDFVFIENVGNLYKKCVVAPQSNYPVVLSLPIHPLVCSCSTSFACSLACHLLHSTHPCTCCLF
jgi:hypothetical protein